MLLTKIIITKFLEVLRNFPTICLYCSKAKCALCILKDMTLPPQKLLSASTVLIIGQNLPNTYLMVKKLRYTVATIVVASLTACFMRPILSFANSIVLVHAPSHLSFIEDYIC